VGGLFTVAMHGRPVLDKPLKSSLKYTVLLNPPLFTNREHFQAEHLLMYGNSRIADHFFLLQQPKERLPRDDDIERLMGPLAAFGPGGFMSENYQTWDAQPVQKLPMQRRLSRPALEKWLYAHFLKICLPHPRPRSSQAPVHAPLNLTAFLRLVAHLAPVGYPAHWLAGVLTALVHPNGEITTTARPPRKLVTDQADVDAVFPPAKMAVAPWQAEFSTLLAVWSRLLPFSFIASPNTLVAPTEIAEYTVTFPAFRDSHLRVPHFMLLFWDASQGDIPPSIDRILRDDEKGDTSTSARRIKRKAIHIFQAFQYVRDTRTASFWSRSDLIRAMKEGKWMVYIWRTDDWTRVTHGVDVKDGVTQKGLWTE
jgi:hypothetical protein